MNDMSSSHSQDVEKQIPYVDKKKKSSHLKKHNTLSTEIISPTHILIWSLYSNTEFRELTWPLIAT